MKMFGFFLVSFYLIVGSQKVLANETKLTCEIAFALDRNWYIFEIYINSDQNRGLFRERGRNYEAINKIHTSLAQEVDDIVLRPTDNNVYETDIEVIKIDRYDLGAYAKTVSGVPAIGDCKMGWREKQF